MSEEHTQQGHGLIVEEARPQTRHKAIITTPIQRFMFKTS